jgi:outer membrane protein insertion porin family
VKRSFQKDGLVFGLSLAALALASPAMAQGFAPAAAPSYGVSMSDISADPVARDIEVKGVQRLEKETVLSYLSMSKGDAVTPAKIDASLKALYATGLFADVQLDLRGSTLVVEVTENPIVNRVGFEGNDAISLEDLQKEVQLKPRLVYTLPRVQKDQQRILDLYRRQGRFGAAVEPKLVHLEQNRVDVVFVITEGERTGVQKIAFVGNSKFDESELRDVVNTRESAWWRFLSSSDFYDPDRMAYDRELLRKFYLNEGYVDFRVASSVAELTPDRKDFFLTFALDEGKRYHFGKVGIQCDIKGVDPESLKQYLTTHEGDWYSAGAVEKTIDILTTAMGDRQYAFVEITPDVERHKDGLTVDLTYHIKQGQRVYIGRIEMSGNQRTMDKVIRRELQLAEGDPFSTSKMKRSEQRIKDLGYFDDVKVTPVDGNQPDRANLKVDVKEKSTGEISVGAGFSSTDGPLGDFSIHEKNFLGKGQDARLGATISGITKQFTFSFTEPYFLDRDLSAGFDLFHTRSDYQDYSDYDERNTGATLRMGYPLSDELRQRVSYSFQETELLNISATASRYIRDQEGVSTRSIIAQELIYDTRDSKLEPTKGFVTHLNTDFAGAGGSRKFFRAKFGGTQYYPVAEQYVFSVMGEIGQVWGLEGQNVSIADRFFLGSDTLRGFEYAGIGPRDVTGDNTDALGGNRFSRGTIELITPTPFPTEIGLKGHIFTDFGTLGKVDEIPAAGDVFMTGESLHMGAGVGLSWQSPFGPIRLDIAKAVLKESYDKTEVFHFSFGTRF